MISLSPLSRTLPRVLQHPSVGASPPVAGRFTLVLPRSPEFGSFAREGSNTHLTYAFACAYTCQLKQLPPRERKLATPLYQRYPRTPKRPQSLSVVEVHTPPKRRVILSLTVLVSYRSAMGRRPLERDRPFFPPSILGGWYCWHHRLNPCTAPYASMVPDGFHGPKP